MFHIIIYNSSEIHNINTVQLSEVTVPQPNESETSSVIDEIVQRLIYIYTAGSAAAAAATNFTAWKLLVGHLACKKSCFDKFQISPLSTRPNFE